MSDPVAEPKPNPEMEEGIPGKKLLPILVVGCLLFCLILGFGTFFIAKWTTPFFERREQQREGK